MAGLLLHPPTQDELERLYHELARLGAPSVGRDRPWPYGAPSREDLIALAAEMLRYDARLLTILLKLLLATWERLDVLALRRAMRGMRWPQALLVVTEFAREATDDPELVHLIDYLEAGFGRVEPAERFFIGMERPGSRVAERRRGRNLKPYARWGFVGVERPIVDLATKATLGRYDRRTRLDILGRLVEERGEITLADYLDAVDHTISRQQALADLRSAPRLQLRGRGRGARWRAKRNKSPARQRPG